MVVVSGSGELFEEYHSIICRNPMLCFTVNMKSGFILLCTVATAINAAAVTSDTRAPLLDLNDGHKIPSLGLGTWLGFAQKGGRVQPRDAEVQHAVEAAIDAGYRLIDTAYIYQTEPQVGEAIKSKIAEGKVKREDLFITTKLWNDQHAEAAVVPALRESLRLLQLDYVDLYLIHWPVAVAANGSLVNIDYLETWRGMIEARNLGLTKSIGVSNFNQKMIERITQETGVKPAVLQVEINLNLQQPGLLSYCREQNIRVMGYTPFGSLFYNKATEDAPLPRVDEPKLVEVARKYNKTVPQVVLRYLMYLGVIPIPKSVTKSRVEQNFQVFDFQLSQEERDLLKSYDRNYRTIPVKVWIDSPYYPFEKN